MMQKGLAQTPGSILVTNMLAPRGLDPLTPVHPASSLCLESSFQLKFDYWFLILVPFFMLMALLADSELPWVQIKYNRIANQAIRICWQEEIYKLSDLGGLSPCLWDRILLISNGPLHGTGSDIGNRHLQAAGGAERVAARPASLHWFGWFSLQEKSCPVSTQGIALWRSVSGDHCLMFHTLFSCKKVLRFNSPPSGPQGRHQMSGKMNSVFRFLNLDGRWECASGFPLVSNSERR